jgi:molybdenum cofactor cytidylyltransferase
MPLNPTPALILAAGMSSRMNFCKYLLPYRRTTVLGSILQTVADTEEIAPIFVVTGHFQQEITPLLNEYSAIGIHNEDYQFGEMFSSIQAGVRAIPSRSQGLLLLLGDQPFITIALLKALLHTAQETGAPIVQPLCNGRKGHPLYLSEECLNEIRELPTNSTLKTVVSLHSSAVVTVPVEDARILQDIDTQEDYLHLIASLH